MDDASSIVGVTEDAGPVSSRGSSGTEEQPLVRPNRSKWGAPLQPVTPKPEIETFTSREEMDQTLKSSNKINAKQPESK